MIIPDDSKHLYSDKWLERGGVSHKPKTQLKGGQCESGRQAGSDRAQAVPRQTKTRDRFGRPRPVAREHYTTLRYKANIVLWMTQLNRTVK